MSEKTLCIIKPDAVENNFVDQINEMIESKGLSILKSKKTNISSEIAKQFYAEHSEKPFFNELVDFITSGPAVVQILEGDACITSYRSLMGQPIRKKLKRELLERNLLSQFLKMRYMVQTHQNLQTEKLK